MYTVSLDIYLCSRKHICVFVSDIWLCTGGIRAKRLWACKGKLKGSGVVEEDEKDETEDEEDEEQATYWSEEMVENGEVGGK